MDRWNNEKRLQMGLLVENMFEQLEMAEREAVERAKRGERTGCVVVQMVFSESAHERILSITLCEADDEDADAAMKVMAARMNS